jgi:hypothetical protein
MKTKFLVIALVVCLFSNAQAQVPSYVPSNGLVGWWPFNGNANDESGIGNNGAANGATLTTDRYGVANKAYSFDGVNDFIDFGDIQSLNNSNAFSVSAFFNYNFPPTFPNDWYSVVADGSYADLNGWGILIKADQILMRELDGFNGVNLNYTFLQNNWYHVVATCESDSLKIFVNGEFIGGSLNLQPNLTLNTSNSLRAGNGAMTNVPPNSHPYYFSGKIDDIGIWNRALTQQEITNLYNSSAYVPCASPAFPANLASGLVGYWPFCGDANDESGNGNNGTVNGATLTSDRFGNPNSAYYFDGVNASIATNANFSNSNNAKSISVWAKFSDLGNRGWLVSNNTCINGSNYDGFGFFQEGPSQNFYFYGMNNGDRLISNQLDTSLFYHFVAAFQQDTLKVYLNGLEVTTSYNPLNTNSANGVLFGDRFSGVLSGPCGNDNLTGGLFNGILDDIGIWNRALNASEIQQLYNTGIYFQTVTGSCDTLQFNANITGFNPVTYQNQVKVFPNPAKDNLVIDCGANFNTLTGYSMKILNTVGQSVYNSLITQQVTNIPLTAPTWSPGAYIVQFINPTGTVIEAKQIIIQ